MNWIASAKSASAGGYLKLPNKDDHVVVALIGEPWAYIGKFSSTLNRTVLFDENDPSHKDDEDFKEKIRAAFYVKGDGTTLIFDQPARHFGGLAELLKGGLKPDGKWIRLTRAGVAKATKYEWAPDNDMTKDEKAEIANVPVKDIRIKDPNQADY